MTYICASTKKHVHFKRLQICKGIGNTYINNEKQLLNEEKSQVEQFHDYKFHFNLKQ